MQPITIASTRIYSLLAIEMIVGVAIARAAVAATGLARLKHRRD